MFYDPKVTNKTGHLRNKHLEKYSKMQFINGEKCIYLGYLGIVTVSHQVWRSQ